MKKYTLKENVISFLIGTIIAVIICAVAFKDRYPDPEIKSASAEVEPLKTVSINSITPVYDVAVLEVESEGVEVPKKEYVGEFEIRAYCPCEICCPGTSDGITYTGTVATEGRTIAVDPDVIPLGSLVIINNRGYVAEDIGGGVKGNMIDIFFNSHEDALEWGVRYSDISKVNY